MVFNGIGSLAIQSLQWTIPDPKHKHILHCKQSFSIYIISHDLIVYLLLAHTTYIAAVSRHKALPKHLIHCKDLAILLAFAYNIIYEKKPLMWKL